MSSQNKFLLILVILIVILLIGGGVIGFLYWQKGEQQEVVEEPVVEEQVQKNINTEINSEGEVVAEEVEIEETEKKEINDEDFLQQLAKSFTERYGSFSNQNDYENLLDLKIYMTKKMQGEVDEFVEKNKSEDSETSAYYGITTKVLSVKQVDLEGDKANYIVSCQRKEAGGLEGSSNTYSQQAKIEFKKVDGQWKVHSFAWL